MGSVVAKSSDGEATGIKAGYKSGVIKVDGEVLAEGSSDTTGVYTGSSEKGNVPVGSITARSENDNATGIYAMAGKVSVAGDVSVKAAEGYKGRGIELTLSGADVAVDGTVAANVGVYVSGSGDTGRVTVWKIEADIENSIVQGEHKSPEDCEAYEKKINYIVRVDNELADVLGARNRLLQDLGTSQGYDVAHSGDRVYLKVLEEGLKIKETYNGMGERVLLQYDGNGWYLDVPKGGGVYLSAIFEGPEPDPDPEDPTEEESEDPSEDDVDDDHTDSETTIDPVDVPSDAQISDEPAFVGPVIDTVIEKSEIVPSPAPAPAEDDNNPEATDNEEAPAPKPEAKPSEAPTASPSRKSTESLAPKAAAHTAALPATADTSVPAVPFSFALALEALGVLARRQQA